MSQETSKVLKQSGSNLSLAEQLILLEESKREVEEPLDVEEASEEMFFLERENITKSSRFRPSPSALNHEGDLSVRNNLPIKAKGKLMNFLVIADSTDMSIKMEVDSHNIINETFRNLRDITQDLENVSAYRDGSTNEAIVSITDYPFDNWFNAFVIPGAGAIEIKRIRIEAIIEEWLQ